MALFQAVQVCRVSGGSRVAGRVEFPVGVLPHVGRHEWDRTRLESVSDSTVADRSSEVNMNQQSSIIHHPSLALRADPRPRIQSIPFSGPSRSRDLRYRRAVAPDFPSHGRRGGFASKRSLSYHAPRGLFFSWRFAGRWKDPSVAPIACCVPAGGLSFRSTFSARFPPVVGPRLRPWPGLTARVRDVSSPRPRFTDQREV